MGCFQAACATPAVARSLLPTQSYETMIIVEDGSIVANANSFVTSAEVLSHALLTGQNAAWTALTSLAQEQAIYRASQTLNGYEKRFLGCRVSSRQTLTWPRYGAVVNGYELSSNQIPREIKQAACELALREVTARATMPDEIVTGGSITEEAREVGPLKTRTKYSSPKGRGVQPYFPSVMALLRPFLISPGSLIQH